MDVRNKSDKMFDQMHKMSSELEKIQKQMRRHGMDDILDHLDRHVFNVDDDAWETMWSMFSRR
jgi:hypothetical protein